MIATVHQEIKSRNVTPCKIAIVGDAPTAADILNNEIFSESIGHELSNWLHVSDIHLNDCMQANVFSHKPIMDDIKRFYIGIRESKKLIKEHSDWNWPQYPARTSYGYISKEHEHDIQRLADEIKEANPNVILALGSTALHVLTGQDKLNTHRGTVLISSELFGKRKVVPTYHPSTVFRAWGNRSAALADVRKAVEESTQAHISKQRREIWLEPTLQDLHNYTTQYLEPIKGTTQPICFDIETSKRGQITCVGIAPSAESAIVIPFVIQGGGNYWPSLVSEIKAWEWLASILEDPSYNKLAHNATYDIMWLSMKVHINVRGNVEDTMLMQHALQPEHKKSLGYLGSLYTNEQSWKALVKHD